MQAVHRRAALSSGWQQVVVASVVMVDTLTAYIVTAYKVIACIFVAHIVTAHIVAGNSVDPQRRAEVAQRSIPLRGVVLATAAKRQSAELSRSKKTPRGLGHIGTTLQIRQGN